MYKLLEFIFTLSKLQVAATYAIIIILNLCFSLLIRYLVNKKYNKTGSVEEAMYLQMILSKYPQMILIAISVFFTTIISMPYIDELGDFGFFGGMFVGYLLFIVIVILNQSIMYNTNKTLRKTTTTRGKEIKNLLKVLMFIIIPMVILLMVMEYNPGENIFGGRFKKYLGIIIPVFVYLILSVIMPLFYKYLLKAKEFQDEDVKTQLTSFIQKAGVNNFRLLLWPTKDNKHANALVSGLIRKDVFISDYLVDNFTIDEIKGVLAHEIGHIKKKHLWVRTAFTLGIFVVFPLLGEAMDIYEENFNEIPIAFGIGIFIVVLISYLGFLRHYINRTQERQADAYVLEMGIDAEAYINALYKLSSLNNMVLKFNKLDEKLQTHPSTAKRIKWIAKEAGVSLDKFEKN